MKFVIAAIVLAGCATATPIHMPSGKMGLSITCDGSAGSWSECFQKAGETCGARGYEVIEKSGDQSLVGAASGQSGFVGSVVRRNMLVQCKD